MYFNGNENKLVDHNHMAGELFYLIKVVLLSTSARPFLL